MAQVNLTFKENFIESFAVDGDVTIGSAPSCDIHIDSLAVQPQHAKIVKNGDTFTITSMSVNAKTQIIGRVTSSQQL